MAAIEGYFSTGVWADLKRWFGKSLRVLLPMACSAALLCWLFHRVNFNDMMAVIRHDVNYWWLALMLVFNFFSYVIRGSRWGLQLGGAGIHVRQKSLWVSIFGAYALNLLFTGFGETWRCLFISRIKHAPLTTVIGTDLGDRLTDLVAVLLILLLTFFVADDSIAAFIRRYAIGRDADHVLGDPLTWAIAIGVVAVLWSIGHFMRRFRIVDIIDTCCHNIWCGLKVVVTMPHKGRFLLLTLAIWLCYFMQTYVCFFAFPFTRQLITPELCYGLTPGLVALLFGSMSMAIPSSGGLGPWNIAIIFSLTLYGVDQTDATAFAMLAWGLEAAFQVCLGIFTAIYVARLKPDATGPTAKTTSVHS